MSVKVMHAQIKPLLSLGAIPGIPGLLPTPWPIPHCSDWLMVGIKQTVLLLGEQKPVSKQPRKDEKMHQNMVKFKMNRQKNPSHSLSLPEKAAWKGLQFPTDLKQERSSWTKSEFFRYNAEVRKKEGGLMGVSSSLTSDSHFRVYRWMKRKKQRGLSKRFTC